MKNSPSVERHVVLELLLALLGGLVTRVGDPAVSLHEDGGAEVLVLVPPVLLNVSVTTLLGSEIAGY